MSPTTRVTKKPTVSGTMNGTPAAIQTGDARLIRAELGREPLGLNPELAGVEPGVVEHCADRLAEGEEPSPERPVLLGELLHQESEGTALAYLGSRDRVPPQPCDKGTVDAPSPIPEEERERDEQSRHLGMYEQREREETGSGIAEEGSERERGQKQGDEGERPGVGPADQPEPAEEEEDGPKDRREDQERDRAGRARCETRDVEPDRERRADREHRVPRPERDPPGPQVENRGVDKRGADRGRDDQERIERHGPVPKEEDLSGVPPQKEGFRRAGASPCPECRTRRPSGCASPWRGGAGTPGSR